jgi:hypothetical protein
VHAAGTACAAGLCRLRLTPLQRTQKPGPRTHPPIQACHIETTLTWRGADLCYGCEAARLRFGASGVWPCSSAHHRLLAVSTLAGATWKIPETTGCSMAHILVLEANPALRTLERT